MTIDDYLETDDNAEPDEDVEAASEERDGVMNARNRYARFKQQLLECDTITAVTNGPERNVDTARTKSGDVFVWMHYSKAFDFWGGAVTKNDTLRSRAPALVHAFLGERPDEYYVVPDEALHSGAFYMPVQDKNGSKNWKLEGDGGGGKNRERLEKDYTALCAPFR